MQTQLQSPEQARLAREERRLVKPATRHYKTAYATVSCSEFKVGDCVSVEWSHAGDNGIDWYYIRRTEHGPTRVTVAYPSNHLTDFCL